MPKRTLLTRIKSSREGETQLRSEPANIIQVPRMGKKKKSKIQVARLRSTPIYSKVVSPSQVETTPWFKILVSVNTTISVLMWPLHSVSRSILVSVTTDVNVLKVHTT